MIYLYIYYNGLFAPVVLTYPRNCMAKCTSFVLKTLRSFTRSLHQTMYQTMCKTIYQTIFKPISVFARDSARILLHFLAAGND